MDTPDRIKEVPGILNEWFPDMPWTVITDSSGEFVFLHRGRECTMTDAAVMQLVLHRLSEVEARSRIAEAGTLNVSQLFQALYVLSCGSK